MSQYNYQVKQQQKRPWKCQKMCNYQQVHSSDGAARKYFQTDSQKRKKTIPKNLCLISKKENFETNHMLLTRRY